MLVASPPQPPLAGQSRNATHAVMNTPVARFACDADHNVHECNGKILELLECDSNGLLRQEWRRYVLKSEAPIHQQFLQDINHGRAGSYYVHNISKSGDRLRLKVVTFLVVGMTGLPAVRGVTFVQHIEPSRIHVEVARSRPDQQRLKLRNED